MIRSVRSSPDTIRVKQVNLQHSKMSQMHINNWIDWQGNNRYMCLVQEPYIYQRVASNQPRTANKFIGGQTDSPRSAIYLSKHIDAWYIEELSNRDATVIVVKINNRQTLIASIYLDGKLDVVQHWLTRIAEFTKHRGYGTIIGMDSNCHSTLYGRETNNRGVLLEEFILGNKLTIENKGKKYTYHSNTGKSVIDITLTARLSVTVSDWRVADEEINFSDHNSIYYELKTDKYQPPKARKWHQANWKTFSDHLEGNSIRIQSEITQHRLEECLKQWYKQINNALNLAVPLKPVRLKDINNPWWTKELQRKRKDLRSVYRQKLRVPTEENKEIYRHQFNQFRKECKRAKTADWRKFVEKTSDLSDMNTLRKILQRGRQTTLGILKKPDGSLTNPGKDTLNYLLHAHYPSLEPLSETQHSSTKLATSLINSTHIPGIEASKLISVFNGFKSKKSPGPDQLQPLILKELPENKIQELIFVYKAMILLEFTPSQWKETKVIWIPKPGKDCYKVFKAWRGISLSNYPLKGLEKLIANQADIDMIQVHKNQHGFRRNRSTESAISDTVNYIEKYITQGKSVLGVFLDIQAAFDTIKPEAIKDALLEHNINPLMVNWYYNYLCHRNLHTEHNGESASATIRIGFPQGGVCSAKFWIIAFNKAVEIINQFEALGIGFADDCCILLHRDNIDQAMSLIQRITNELVNWGQTLGLTFNPTKTVCILFSRNTERTIKYPLKKLEINTTSVPFSNETRYLGVQIDAKLNWNMHFDKVTNRAKSYLAGMVGSLNKNWGPKPRLAKWLYTAVVRPRLAYACVTWAHSVTQIYKLKKLEQINKLASALMTPLRHKTPTAALEIINNLPPLELYLDEMGLSTFCRLKLAEKTGWITAYKKKTKLKFRPHLKHWMTQADEALQHIEDEETTHEHIGNKNYHINISAIKGRKKPTLAEVNIYTDGSKTGLGAGAGFVIMKGKHQIIYTQSINLSTTATIFQAELIAIKEAATHIIESDLKPSYIKIFCDSQAALKALGRDTCKANTVAVTHNTLNSLADAHKAVRLQWIKAHIGLDGNELADEYAKLGTADTTTHIRTNSTMNQIRTCLSRYTYHKWRDKWRALAKCRQTKLFYPQPDEAKHRQVKQFSRKELKLYIQAVTGQNNLNYLNSLITRDYTSLCRFCEEEDETFAHIVAECPVFMHDRVRLLGCRVVRYEDLKDIGPRVLVRFIGIDEIETALVTNTSEEEVKGKSR